MKTPITYYGGKQNMIRHIMKLIPDHKMYVEPFLGGGALFWTKDRSPVEQINDINDNVINFYQVVLSDFDNLKDKIDNTLYSERIFWRAYKMYCHPNGYTDVERAWAFWMSSNFAHSAKIGGGIKLDNGINWNNIGRTFHLKKQAFQKSLMDRLKFVQITCRDALRVIEGANFDHTFFFLVPPYPSADHGHYKGYTFKNLESLLFHLEGVKGKFMLCNYPSEILTSFIERNGWNMYSYDMRITACHRNLSNKRKTELLVTNYQISDLFNSNNNSLYAPTDRNL